ncbi:MAG TPA: hypothetical protein VFJ85_11160 [Acidimicrobiales bacterium]|nr:hypothetical protein [Acidimicrobiales bacterium]
MAATTGCSCGCGEMTAVTSAAPCTCGCECCGEAKSREDEIAELHTLKKAIDTRLEELAKGAVG